MNKFSIPVFLSILILLIASSTTTLAFAQSMNMNMSSNPATANTDPSTITSQITQLQQQLTQKQQTLKQLETQKQQLEAKHFQEIRSQLYTTDLPTPSLTAQAYDKIKNCNPDQKQPEVNSSAYNNWWKTYLTDFHCGHVVPFPSNHTALREFKLIFNDNNGFGTNMAITKNSTDPVLFPSWTINSTVPAPTLRVTQGDHVRITVINSNTSKFPHSFHMHSIHSGAMDGMFGPAGLIAPGTSFTFDFVARPYGVYPFHCHVEPVEQHIQRGLYGLLIIDPPVPRPQAKELVMMQNGFSFNQINLQNPNNDVKKMLLPPSAQALRAATADIGSTGMATADDNGGEKATAAPAIKTAGFLGETPKQAAVKNDDKDPASATIKNQDKLMKDDANGPEVTGTRAADDNNNNNDDANNQQQAKDDALEPGGGDNGNDNQFYAVNSKAFGYEGTDAIKLKVGEPVRIYLANMVEFDPMNSFHLHGNMFGYIPSGTAMQPKFINDIVTLGQGDRGIIQFTYPLAGQYMFHAHINRFTNLGWQGVFNVAPKQ